MNKAAFFFCKHNQVSPYTFAEEKLEVWTGYNVAALMLHKSPSNPDVSVRAALTLGFLAEPGLPELVLLY